MLLTGKRRRHITNHRGVIPSIIGTSRSTLDTRIRCHSHDDYILHIPLSELVVQIRILERRTAPLLGDHHILVAQIRLQSMIYLRAP